MEQEFTKDGLRYSLLVRPRRPLRGAEVEFRDRASALTFLGGCTAIRVFRDGLARLDPTVGQKVGKLTDRQVLEAVATALVNGTMVLVQLHQPGVAQHPLTAVDQLLNLNLPQLGRQAGVIPDLSLDGLGISPKGQEVSRRYLSKLEQMTQVRVRDLFNPNLQTVEGFPFLKQINQDQALDWAKDFMLDMPLGDTGIGRSLGGVFGLDDAQLAFSPKELGKQVGDEVGDRVKGWVDDLRGEHPALFYGGATLAAVGAGALTYAQGSTYLEKVGANKFSQELFGDRVQLDGDFSFGPRFSDLSGSLGAREKISEGLTLWQKVEGGGASFKDLDLTKFGVGADYNLSERLNMGVGYTEDHLQGGKLLNGYLGGQSGGASYRLESLYDLGSGDHRVSAYAGKQFSNGGFIEGYARYEKWGGVEQGVAGVMGGFKF